MSTFQANALRGSHSAFQINVLRGSQVESRHQVHAYVCDSDGRAIESWGDVQQLVYPRSAIKMIQALSLIESGAAEKFKLTDAEISIACASHAGDARHTSVVQNWLMKIGLSENDLECGAHVPGDEKAAAQLILQNQKPSRLHNNCSGKHSGILTTALQMGWATRDYSKWDHPVQARLRKILSELSDLNYENAKWGVDGCSIPTYAIPLSAIAVSMSRLIQEKASASGQSAGLVDSKSAGSVNRKSVGFIDRKTAAQILLKAVRNEPDMVAGPKGLCSQITKVTKGRIFAKTGAEGVYTALAPDKGISIALKTADGGTRAAQFAVVHLLKKFGGLTDAEVALLDTAALHPLKNWAGQIVGEIQIQGASILS